MEVTVLGPLISVIIPVYNAEKYLAPCVESVLSQSQQNWETILINDGSTDGSAALCEHFEKMDYRFTVIHQKNAGVSAARNKGLEKARGKWICFVDSDDVIGQNYFQSSIDSSSDFIMLNVDVIEGAEIKNFTNYPPNTMDLETFMQNYKLYPNFAGPWSKFFKNTIIQDYHLRFDVKLSFGEDALFNLQYLKHCRICEVTNQSSYFYRESAGTLSKKKSSYTENFYFFTLLQKELYAYKDDIYIQHIISPLNRLLISLYRDSEIPFSGKREELKRIVSDNYSALKELYKNSTLQKLFILARNTGSYRVLNRILNQKLGETIK